MTKPLPSDLLDALPHELTTCLGSNVSLKAFSPTGGGCINETGILTTSHGQFFLKWNSRARFPDMLRREQLGLQLLKKSSPLHVPEVVVAGETQAHQFLVLECINAGAKKPSYWQDLGRGLAVQHKRSNSSFGLDHDNYIGSLYQSNASNDSWIDFFIQERLEKQLDLMKLNGYRSSRLDAQFKALYQRLPKILVNEPPALLHGDLWSGNVMVNARGMPCIIDPAVYYGNREMDLAMTQLFGGFPSDFYDAYREINPQEDDFARRCEIYNLYPLLVHVNLFGGSYLTQVQAVLDRYA